MRQTYLGVPPGDFQEHTVTLLLYKGAHRLRRDFLDADLYSLNFKLLLKPYECSLMTLPKPYICFAPTFDTPAEYPTIELEYDRSNPVSPFATFTFDFADLLLLERVRV